MISGIAQICSMPVIIYYFHQVPLLSVLANLVVVPLVSIGVVGVMILLLADLIWPVLGLLVGSWLSLELNFIVDCLKFFGGENIPVVKIGMAASQASLIFFVIGFYLFLILIGQSLKKKIYRRWAVISILLLLNTLLVFQVMAGLKKTRMLAECLKVPGGIMTCIYQQKAGQGDLIITGLSRKDYSIKDRIIDPWLERRRISRINKIFVQSIEYGAIEDLLEIIRKYNIHDIYIKSNCRSSFEEVRMQSNISFKDREVVFYGGLSGLEPYKGYFLSDDYIKFLDEHHSIYFLDRIDPGLDLKFETDKSQVLVLGQTWYPTPAEWHLWFNRGIDMLVCSKIEQYHQFTHLEESPSVEEALPGYLFDLSREGPGKIVLAE
jgi:hypothetical protein